MAKCDRCGTEIKTMPFSCRFCGKIFCEHHQLPENHGCIRLHRLKERNIKRLAEGRNAIDFRTAKRTTLTKSEQFEIDLERKRQELKKRKGFWKRFLGI